MLKTKPESKLKETRQKFLQQTYARVTDVKSMRGDINRRKENLSNNIQKELEYWIINLDMNINLAAVEIEFVENSNEFNWEKHRARVNEALGIVENDIATGYQILEKN